MGVNPELIEEAKRCLVIGQVTMAESSFKMNPDIHLFEQGQVRYQMFKQTTSFDEYSTDENGGTAVVYRYAVGIRAIPLADAEEEQPEILAEIRAEYDVGYECAEKPSPECLREFGLVNVGFNVWPFWREYVQSCCMRMGIPPITIGFYEA